MQIAIDHKAIRDIIASDPGFEVEVRAGVLKSAIKKGTEKLLCQSDTEMVRQLVREVMSEHKRPDSWSWKPDERFKAMVNKEVERRIEEVIEQKVAQALAKDLDTKIEKVVLKYVSSSLLEVTAKLIEGRMSKKLVDAEGLVSVAVSKVMKKLREETYNEQNS